MAEPLPASLKVPEVSRFINRANQLRTIKPAIAYWCEYHAVNQIVGKNLHTTDDDAFNFTKILLERLEQTKIDRADDDAVVDNTAGQAYVEQFAQQTFDRAERTLRANKVTRQTADTFDAAATFFDLTREWGTPEPEVLQKIKFAKWNAARILKAIRQGEDPNESNPKPVEEEQLEPALDPNDPDVMQLSGAGPRSATVEDAPDIGEPSAGPLPTFIDQPPTQPVDQGYFPPPPPPEKSPEPFIPSPMSQSPPPGPSMPPPVVQQPLSQTPTPGGPPPLPSQQPSQFSSFPMPQIPPQQSPQMPRASPQFTPSAPSPFGGPDPSAPPSWSTTPSVPHPAMSNPPPAIPQPQAPVYSTPPPVVPRAHIPPPAPAPAPAPVPTGFKPDQRAMNQAQKHAKWAISALNFEDVPTAVKELRNALAALGAQ
ncbi:Vta1 like-domain-containing protein [Thelonectria olida]|uniref:Vta1 like-domain-containing protein n=1 Tax=Thelonectria olida TaxID=1576542 RepID=A0A9P8W4H2_9HYPO|nr:Vta1 like-domain-containing protein [Thelonectria olida]